MTPSRADRLPLLLYSFTGCVGYGILALTIRGALASRQHFPHHVKLAPVLIIALALWLWFLLPLLVVAFAAQRAYRTGVDARLFAKLSGLGAAASVAASAVTGFLLSIVPRVFSLRGFYASRAFSGAAVPYLCLGSLVTGLAAGFLAGGIVRYARR